MRLLHRQEISEVNIQIGAEVETTRSTLTVNAAYPTTVIVSPAKSSFFWQTASGGYCRKSA
jgi:hypothetical protein